MLRNLAKAIPLPACMILTILLFALIWPIVVLCLLDQNDGSIWSTDPSSVVYVWTLWSPAVKTIVYQWSFICLAFIGVFIGIDAALRIKWGDLRLNRWKTRLFFFVFHALVVLAIVGFDAYGLLQPIGKWFSVQQADYLLLVEGLPILWFIYSWLTLRQSSVRRKTTLMRQK